MRYYGLTVAVLMTALFFGISASGVFMEELNKESKTVVLLLGPPGSGKGTQAKRLSKEKNIPHISTGDLFRDHMNRETTLGKKAQEFIAQGKLVPDQIVLDMVFDRVSQEDCRRGYLLDGFPRTEFQARSLERFLSSAVKPVVINLDVSDDTVIKRVAGRLSCQNCGNIQNRFFNPPKKENICDRCGGELDQRKDDTAEVVKERLAVYYKQTAPLITYYKKQGLLHTVNGELKPDEIYEKILQLSL